MAREQAGGSAIHRHTTSLVEKVDEHGRSNATNE